MVAHPWRPLGRGQGSAEPIRQGFGRWPAAAPLYRTYDRRAAGSDPVRRTDQRPRSDQHAQDRGTDRRTEARFHHCHRDAQHAAGCPLRRSGGVLLSGGNGRGCARRADVHRSQGKADTGIHHWPVRLIEEGEMSEAVPEHLVKSYDQELNKLRNLMTEMGGIVENQVALAAEAILHRDAAAATRAVEEDPKADALEREIEAFAIRLLALRQPMASDLRHIVAALKITGDIERIGDYAANVAKRSIVLSQFSTPFSLAGLAHMATLVQGQLKSIIDALGDNDADKAVEVWRSDQVVDDIYNAIFRELITYMMEDPRNITPCTHLLFIAKNLERIGDHATNIAENLYYAVKGESLPEARPKGDTSAYAVVRPRE